MKNEGVMERHRCFGSATVGPRGQIVIPASARRELGMDAGDTIFVFKAFMGQPGLLLIKADAMEQMLSLMSAGLARFEKIVREQKTKAVKGKKEG